MYAAPQAKKAPLGALPYLIASLLALVFGCLALSPGEKPRQDAALARLDGFTVLRGAPERREKARQTRDALLSGPLVLASPLHPLPSDAPPPVTRSIRALVGSYLPVEGDAALRKEAVYALCTLQTEHSMAEKAVLTDGAVSRAQQDQRLREAFARCQQVYPLSEALRRAGELAPRGGESEHQTGWAIDIKLLGPLSLGQEDPISRTEYGQWLKENLWRYGFIRRYASSAEEGSCEGIHLRYVGPLHAAAMHALETPLEGYWALLRREGALTLQTEGKDAAYIYCAACDGDGSCLLPSAQGAQYSADNTGWAAALIPAEGRR